LMVAAILALAPFHTAIVTGNVTLVAVELSVVAIWMARSNHNIATAFLLAMATGLKPQIGLCFVFYYLLRRRWRVAGIALALVMGVLALGLLRLELGHTPWFSNYLSDNRILLETGVLGNFTSINPTRFGLINLQVALYPIFHDVRLTNGVAMAIGGTFLIVWLIMMGRSDPRGDCELRDLSAIAVISLLPVYHRFYDATLLILPLCWAFLSFRRARVFALGSLLLMFPFLVPGGTMFETMQLSGRIPFTLSQHWWWQTVVMPHQVWILLCLGILLLWEMDRDQLKATDNAKNT
jgi:hypothetical protein